MTKVWLGLGSNRGESLAILHAAIEELRTLLDDLKVSGFWKSRARYYEDQDDFINAAVSGFTMLDPHELLARIHAIEAAHGRDRTREFVKGPRTLDIDILLYGNAVLAEPDLIIPHAGLQERKFVLLPLLELDPDLVHPVLELSLMSIAASLPPQGIYPLVDDRYDAPYPQ
ncbi:MAG: 2-amino-4-hydroxy-6-hydroxymethyldihydropteridine diphosphokinase [Rectinemataceae bacterium]